MCLIPVYSNVTTGAYGFGSGLTVTVAGLLSPKVATFGLLLPWLSWTTVGGVRLGATTSVRLNLFTLPGAMMPISAPSTD